MSGRPVHKGWVLLGDGQRLEPLTVTDSHSRYGVFAHGDRHDGS